MRAQIAIAAALGLLALSSSARAQTAPSESSSSTRRQDLEEAKALTKKAEVEFKLGHFEESLAQYSAAYEKYPTAALLHNIGQCHRMLKNYEKAIFFYQGYLRDKPDAPNRTALEALIAELRKDLDAQRAEAAAREQERREAEERGLALAPPPPPTVPPPPPADTGKPGSPALRLAGFVTAGGGVALIVTGVVLGLRASSASSQLELVGTQHQVWTPADQSTYNSGQTFATAATALYVVGGVAVAAGGVLAFLGWPKKGAEASTTASVAPAPGGASLLLKGTF